LRERAGTGTVETNLAEVATKSLGFYRGIVPMACGAVADQDLLRQHREFFHENNTGPNKIINALTGYLANELRAGRIAGGVSPEAVAHIVQGACFAHSFLDAFLGERGHGLRDGPFVRELIRTVLSGIAPGERAAGEVS